MTIPEKTGKYAVRIVPPEQLLHTVRGYGIGQDEERHFLRFCGNEIAEGRATTGNLLDIAADLVRRFKNAHQSEQR